MPILFVAITAMLVQQTVATTAKVGVPSLIPAVARELDFDAELVLLYTAFYALISLVCMTGCGGVIARFGALRTSQIGCVLMGFGLALVPFSSSAMAAFLLLTLAASLISLGSTAATPASSQILASYAPKKWAPLVFSIKQTGVPAGVVISGLLLVPIAVAYGWRGALIGMAILCIFIAILLQPLRERFDKDRDGTARPKLRDFRKNLYDVLIQNERRILALVAFSFVGMQSIYMSFTITYLFEDLSFSLEEAGKIVGAATVLAIPGRILWGWIGSTLVKPRPLMGLLAIVMACSTSFMGALGSDWSKITVLAVNCCVSLSVLSWHGVLLAEVARLAPAGEAGRITGGVLAFGAVGQIIFPLMFGLGYWLGGYGLAFLVISFPAAIIGLALMVWQRS